MSKKSSFANTVLTEKKYSETDYIPLFQQYSFPSIDLVMGKFQKLFQSGKLALISLDDIPSIAMEQFEHYSVRFIPQSDYVPRNFSLPLKVLHQNGDLSYIVSQPKPSERFGFDLCTYFVDVRDKDVTGRSEMRFFPLSNDPYFKGRPFIGFLGTTESYRRQGLGLRTCKLMNALSHALYNHDVQSTTTITSDGEPFVSRLAELGYFKPCSKRLSNGRQEYIFKDIEIIS